MADVHATGRAPRVALLARAGKAADNLADALRQAGAELVLTADPDATDEATVLAARPAVLLVALEPGIEQALDRFDELLVSPDILVIFDEAEVAARREGWDAARWVRHLSAKLHHHDNVLPPGTEVESTDWHPQPGQVPKPGAALADLDMTAFEAEALARAGTVPADTMQVEADAHARMLESLVAESRSLEADIGVTDAAPDAVVDTVAFDGMSLDSLSLETMSLDEVVLDDVPVRPADSEARTAPAGNDNPFDGLSLEDFQLEDLQLDGMPMDSAPLDADRVDATPARGAMPPPLPGDDDGRASDDIGSNFDPVAFDSASHETVSLDSVPLDPVAFDPVAFEHGDAAGDPPAEVLAFNPSGFDIDDTYTPPTPRAAEPEQVLSFEELIAASMRTTPPPIDEAPAADVVDAAPAPSPAQVDAPRPSIPFGGLSLVSDEEEVFTSAPGLAREQSAPTHDLAALEARISGLSLVDIDDGTSTEEAVPEPPLPPPLPPAPGQGSTDVASIGLVLIEAGLGGPDPVRQVLAALPGDFRPAVLVRLRLQGGRYDRLVTQMERAASLPVHLAQDGQLVRSGAIHFLSEGMGLTVRGDAVAFAIDDAPESAMYAALPAASSTVLFLSGSESTLVDAAMSVAAKGGQVFAQLPEDCYDGIACADLRARGVDAGLPADLAGRLVSRWPS